MNQRETFVDDAYFSNAVGTGFGKEWLDRDKLRENQEMELRNAMQKVAETKKDAVISGGGGVVVGEFKPIKTEPTPIDMPKVVGGGAVVIGGGAIGGGGGGALAPEEEQMPEQAKKPNYILWGLGGLALVYFLFLRKRK